MPEVKKPKLKELAAKSTLTDPQYYFNRELSWLEFNRRVLHEALDDRTLLLEKLKFIAIFSANLDEFFMVRVAVLKEQVEACVRRLTPDGRSPQAQLDAIRATLSPMVQEQHRYFEQTLHPALAEHGIYLLNYIDLNQEQRHYLQHYFERRIFPVLTPLAVDPGHPFPFISNLSLNLAVVVKDPVTEVEHFARVKVPNSLPRFILFPPELHYHEGKTVVWMGTAIEQVIAHNLELLFPGMIVQESSLFRVTRDADIEVEEDEAEDLLEAIQQELRKRRLGGCVVRLELQVNASASVRRMLMREMDLSEQDVYEIEGLLNLRDLMTLTSLSCPALKDSTWVPVTPPRLRAVNEMPPTSTTNDEEESNFFSVIQQGDVLVHHPYESFTTSVERFITQAAHDPQVLAIKMTLYRTTGDSPIAHALVAAAENGKQVVALVELKARFDEENNINWALKLEQSGVHVVYGLVGLKTHTKIVLVARQEDEDIRRYVHIGTGNYNSKTARLYTDLGLLSCREDLGADLTDLFNYLTGYSRQQAYRKLLVAPVNMRDRKIALIRREIEHCKQNKPARIVAKMNSLVDPQMIQVLYEASQAGVEINLIIRGICCLRPGIEGISDHIRVISIVGRYLEHSRIFYFHNAGEPELLIGSADWMTRNLSRRVEAVTPVEDEAIASELKNILDILWSDNRHAWELQPDGSYVQRCPAPGEAELDAQKILMERVM